LAKEHTMMQATTLEGEITSYSLWQFMVVTIEGYSIRGISFVKSTKERVDQYLDIYKGDIEAAIDAAIEKNHGYFGRFIRTLGEFVPVLGIPLALFNPLWRVFREVAFIAGCYGHDLNCTEIRFKIYLIVMQKLTNGILDGRYHNNAPNDTDSLNDNTTQSVTPNDKDKHDDKPNDQDEDKKNNQDNEKQGDNDNEKQGDNDNDIQDNNVISNNKADDNFVDQIEEELRQQEIFMPLSLESNVRHNTEDLQTLEQVKTMSGFKAKDLSCKLIYQAACFKVGDSLAAGAIKYLAGCSSIPINAIRSYLTDNTHIILEQARIIFGHTYLPLNELLVNINKEKMEVETTWKISTHPTSTWDWIAIYRKVIPAVGHNQYVTFKYVDLVHGKLVFPIEVKSLPPGRYEARYFSSCVGKFGCIVKSTWFEIR